MAPLCALLGSWDRFGGASGCPKCSVFFTGRSSGPPRRPQESPKSFQEAPKRLPRGYKSAPEGCKRLPRRSPDALQGSPEAPKSVKRLPRGSQEVFFVSHRFELLETQRTFTLGWTCMHQRMAANGCILVSKRVSGLEPHGQPCGLGRHTTIIPLS